MLISGCFIVTNIEILSVLNASTEVNSSALECGGYACSCPLKGQLKLTLYQYALLSYTECPISLKPSVVLDFRWSCYKYPVTRNTKLGFIFPITASWKRRNRLEGIIRKVEEGERGRGKVEEKKKRGRRRRGRLIFVLVRDSVWRPSQQLLDDCELHEEELLQYYCLQSVTLLIIATKIRRFRTPGTLCIFMRVFRIH